MIVSLVLKNKFQKFIMDGYSHGNLVKFIRPRFDISQKMAQRWLPDRKECIGMRLFWYGYELLKKKYGYYHAAANSYGPIDNFTNSVLSRHLKKLCFSFF